MSLAVDLSSIERLSPDCLGLLLDKLNVLTGSEGIVNQADLPVVTHYVKALACTSKTMYKAMNSPQITDTLIHSLSKKYLKPPEEIAWALDTVGARRWLWDYTEGSGDRETYEIIQMIRQIFDGIAEGDFFFTGATECTQAGFIFLAAPEPYALITPLGRIHICRKGGYKHWRGSAYSLIAIQRLKGTFQSLRSNESFKETGKIWKVKIPSEGVDITRTFLKRERKKIDVERAKALRGTPILVEDSKDGHLSAYDINEVAGCVVPKVLNHVKPPRNQLLIQHIWEMLEMKREGGDPMEIVMFAPKAEVDRPIPKLQFRHVSEFIPWQMNCVKRLTAQTCPFGLQNLIFESIDEAQLFQGMDLIKPIYSSSFRVDILQHRVYLARQPNLSELKIVYRTNFEQLRSNWKRVWLKDHPEIENRRSEEEYVLFFKDPCSEGMGPCLGLMAKHLGIAGSVMSWDRITQHGWPVYIWVRKDKVEEVITTLDLKILT